MTVVPNLSITGHQVSQILETCGLAYGRGNSSMSTAAQASASQAIAALIKHLSLFFSVYFFIILYDIYAIQI